MLSLTYHRESGWYGVCVCVDTWHEGLHTCWYASLCITASLVEMTGRGRREGKREGGRQKRGREGEIE